MNQSPEMRPDPDEILASLKKEEETGKRGKLKIFFGMCAGVGKTYTMLQAAITDKRKGFDVVAGIVETHNRSETMALVERLEVIPRKQTNYKGTILKEMNIDAILLRNPRIVLVDELAHTNVPGSRHVKRYQDVHELLDNGINVYTTVNVQHLESRSDTVSQITGISIRETIPDEIFENADEIELVDITPDELLERLADGKVYSPERSTDAVRNFFRKGNITALREMSLRLVADRVDKQLRTYMHENRIPGPWKSGLHLLAVVGPSPQSGKLIRWAKNLAYTMGANLTALYVETPRPLSHAQKEQLGRNLNLARQLGAEVITTSGEDPVKAILSVAHKENTTHIIIGKPGRRSMFRLLVLGSFVQNLIRNSGNIDVYVLGSDVADDNHYLRYISAIPAFTSKIGQYLVAVLTIFLASLACFQFTGYLGYQSVSFILLFVVSILATFLGIGPILLAASISALIWNFFFIPPKFTFHIYLAEDVLMLFMFFFIALVNGVLTARVRRQEKLTRDREERTNALFQLTKEIANAENLQALLDISVKDIRKYFGLESVFLIAGNENQLKVFPTKGLPSQISESEMSVAEWVFRHGRKAGKYTDTLPSGEFTYYPLSGTRIKTGVVAIKHSGRGMDEKVEFWDTFLTQISSAIEREFLDELASTARFLNESDKLYKTLFNSISHELRIPVATIMGASDSLLSSSFSPEVTSELTGEILKASLRLNRLIDNLLNMSRLESGRITPKPDWCDAHDLINKVTDNLKEELSSFRLVVVIPDDLPLVKIDFGLVEQSLYNLVFNACQYAPVGTKIIVKAFIDSERLILQIIDKGPGIPEESIPLLFNKFYRVDNSIAGGTGLGLSIVKGFTEAQGGNVYVENRSSGGSRFTIKLPAETTGFDLPV